VDGHRIDLALDNAPATWSLDPNLMQQALSNLPRNAIQASPDGERAEASLTKENGGLVIQVRDHGEGVPEKDRDRIFEPFYITRTRGTGLGLAVARRIVTLHGIITATDHSEGGALFQITIPRRGRASRRAYLSRPRTFPNFRQRSKGRSRN
jgi:two-component system sensor histidine kinase HydH